MQNAELSWPVRHRIALGTARALAFLHHGCCPHLVHRDVNSSNILLDSRYEPHLGDCGLASLIDDKHSDCPTIGGALGYVPPEYGQMWKATTRGDVYSFGVVLLELVTGKRPTGHYFHDSYGGNLVGWVRALIREKKGYKCLDPKLLSTGAESEMLETLRIGYLCTAELPSKRPTMQQIVGLLKDIQPEYI
jgi:serine/threonine protein kinase